MKGASKFFIKGVYLIIVLIIISIIINRTVSLNVISSEEKENLRFSDKASDILEILSGSEKCLAYKEMGSVENRNIELTVYKILNKEKLDEFKNNYWDLEPNCSKDFTYGYRVEVNTFPVNITTSKEKPTTNETISVKISPESWVFGDSTFSSDEAFEKSTTMSIPIMVYYNQSTFLPGVMKITLVSGDLERIVGFIDKSCFIKENLTTSLFVHYPVSLKINGKNYVCMEFKSGKRCQRLACEKQIEFSGINSPGNYIFTSIYMVDVLKINV